MGQRLSVSVSDELVLKIQKLKGKLNISKICQEAIMQALSTEELREVSNSDIEALIVRLKKERMDEGKDFKNRGFQDGSKDAFKLSFNDIHFLYLHQDAMRAEELFDWGASKETKEYVQMCKHEKSMEVGSKEKTDAVFLDYSPFISFEEISDLYYRGWLNGVLFIYSQVQDKLSID